jgi:hypothetical protein
MENPMQGQGAKWTPSGCFLGLIAFAIFATFMVVSAPFMALSKWRSEYRLRCLYRRRSRLLDWKQAKERLSAKRGTLVVAVCVHGVTSGRFPESVWWLEDDLLTKCPDCPLAPIEVLSPSFDPSKRHSLIHNPDAEAWWKLHSSEYSGGVFLVQMPYKYARDWDEVLPACSAFAVQDHWTFQWEDPGTVTFES